ncbi:MAG TPA: NAD-dependent epimerase/dehydratase family protein, partial [Bacteroidales bacterium]|nr:NAD-dependent epimerase/dehydratase family protein [Bacteroidales bacterium]
VGYEETNYLGTIKICDLAKQLNIPKIIFASSSSVYGTNPMLPWNEDTTAVSPVSPYATTKVMSEEYGRKFSEETGIQFTVLRFFSVYGPRMRPDLMMFKIARNILENKEITVFGDGSSKRDYTYIDDIVSGIIQAIVYNGKRFDIFNLGSRNPISLEQIISIFEQITKLKANTKYAPFFTGESNSTEADIRKAQFSLGYHPKTEIQEGIRLFLQSVGTI